jgi:multiple sugar transport system permease protein
LTDRRKAKLGPYAFILPTIIVVVVFWLIPIGKAFLLTLTNAQLLAIGNAKYIGFANYAKFFSGSDLLSIMKATLLYVVFGVGATYLVGLLAATMVNRDFWGKGVARAILILPWMVPQVVLVIIWKWMLNPKYGIINFVLAHLGILPDNFSWFGNGSFAMAAILIATIWKEYPLAMLILLAGMKSIPNEIYDAASVDGANAFQTFLRITLPSLRFVTTILVLLLTIWHFGNFVIIWLMTQGGPGNATATLTVFTYLNAFKFGDLGYGATIGMVIMVVTLGISIAYYHIFIKKTEASV